MLKEVKDWHVYMCSLSKKATYKLYLRRRGLNSDLLEICGKAHSALEKSGLERSDKLDVLPLITLILVLEEPIHA